MRKVTADQVRAAMMSAAITRVVMYECGACHEPVYFYREGSRLWFDPTCGCKSGPRQPRTWQEIADSINYQTDPEIQRRVARKYGLVLGPLVEPEGNGHGHAPEIDQSEGW